MVPVLPSTAVGERPGQFSVVLQLVSGGVMDPDMGLDSPGPDITMARRSFSALSPPPSPLQIFLSSQVMNHHVLLFLPSSSMYLLTIPVSDHPVL